MWLHWKGESGKHGERKWDCQLAFYAKQMRDRESNFQNERKLLSFASVSGGESLTSLRCARCAATCSSPDVPPPKTDRMTWEPRCRCWHGMSQRSYIAPASVEKHKLQEIAIDKLRRSTYVFAPIVAERPFRKYVVSRRKRYTKYHK